MISVAPPYVLAEPQAVRIVFDDFWTLLKRYPNLPSRDVWELYRQNIMIRRFINESQDGKDG